MRIALALLGMLVLAAPAAAAVSAYPSPGTPTASTRTQISLRGVTATDAGQIAVRGARSGAHPGRLIEHSDGQGASFVMAKRFRPGETVTVRTGLSIAGARNGDFRFRIERPVRRPVISGLLLENVAPGKAHAFRTRPDLTVPVVTVTPGAQSPAPGYVILTAKTKNDTKQSGPLIVDSRGQPVYFRPLPGRLASADLRVQTYRGKPVLTYWEGTSRQGIGVGEFVILDQSYRVIKRVQTPNGYLADLHEFLITPQDTALVIAYPAVRRNLSRFGGLSNGTAIDSVVQEIDLETGLVVFEWHSLHQVRLSESFTAPMPSRNVPWDYAHVNSVGLDDDGDFLISARNTWSAFKVDRETARVTWRLGGKRSTFRLGSGVRFAWQHDVRRRSDGAITLFDNSAFPPVRKHSRALAITVDEKTRRATLTSALTHPRGLLTATQGNSQTLPDGGLFVGWGSQRYFTEYTPTGRVRWDARLAIGYETYRAYRSPWVGTPSTRPRVVAIPSGSAATDIYVSWNGATEVARWEILGGESPGSVTPLVSTGRRGFETHVALTTRPAYVAVRALDASGAVLSTSNAVKPARR